MGVGLSDVVKYVGKRKQRMVERVMGEYDTPEVHILHMWGERRCGQVEGGG